MDIPRFASLASVRPFTLITIIALFVVIVVVAVIQLFGRGPRLPCSDHPACRSPVPTATPSNP